MIQVIDDILSTPPSPFIFFALSASTQPDSSRCVAHRGLDTRIIIGVTRPVREALEYSLVMEWPAMLLEWSSLASTSTIVSCFFLFLNQEQQASNN